MLLYILALGLSLAVGWVIGYFWEVVCEA